MLAAFRGRITVMGDRLAFLVFFVALFALGLYATVKPEASKRENEDVPGFPKTGFSWLPVWGNGLSGVFLYLFWTHH